MKQINIHIMNSGRRKESKGAENLFEEIMTENFSSLERKTDLQIHETWRIPNEETRKESWKQQ